MGSIWSASAVTPAATDRIPVDVSSSGAPSRWTGQNVADAASRIGVTLNALGSINSNTEIDLANGAFVTATITGSLTFTFSNPPATGQGMQFVLVLTDGGSAVVTWPGAVTWTGGTAPTLRASGVDVLRFYTSNGGTNWYGELAYDEQSIDAGAILTGTIDAARLPAGTTSAAGALELATVAEAEAGTDTARAVTPEGVAAAISALGLAQPLTTVRWTRQSSVLSAASSGEAKLQFRDIVRAGLIAVRADVGDELLILPGLGHPMIRGFAKRGGGGTTDMNRFGIAEATAGTVTDAAQTITAIRALNVATAASANAQAHIRSSTLGLTGGSSAGQGFLAWGLFGCPDASYGSGATGAKIDVGIYGSGAVGADGNRPATKSALLEYNTNQSDTNWIACVHNGTSNATADTGLAFAAQKTYWYIIHMPRGGSATYFYIACLDDSSSGSATVSATAASADLAEMHSITTLSATARNIRSSCIWTIPGGQL